MIQKISVAVVCNTLDEAEVFIHKLAPEGRKRPSKYLTVETNALRIDWIPYGLVNAKGRRYDYVYTTKEIVESAWYKVVVEPFYICSVGMIDLEN